MTIQEIFDRLIELNPTHLAIGKFAAKSPVGQCYCPLATVAESIQPYNEWAQNSGVVFQHNRLQYLSEVLGCSKSTIHHLYTVYDNLADEGVLYGQEGVELFADAIRIYTEDLEEGTDT